ncbi:MAG: 30S ribosome-binding factor RbfA [Clostridiales bacterium]|jgi:ribosome-binding factor A|nr:30S ribosome-binding factor RbfA [Clostridiales bacterium]
MKGKRTDRLNSEFRKIIYDVIKNKLNIAGVTEMFSITEVDVSPDLKHAKVYISVYSTSEEKEKATFDAICKASPEIRRELAHSTTIRYVPELRFYKDGASAYGNKIDTILAGLTYGDNSNDDDNGNNG